MIEVCISIYAKALFINKNNNSYGDLKINGSLILINIIAGVCLLIWGLDLLKRGMEKGFGDRINLILSRSTSNPIKAFFSGIFVTLLIQSSTAITLLISSFAGERYITLAASLMVMLGSNIGRTIVAQVLTFDISWIIPVCIIIGVVLIGLGKKSSKLKNLGRISLAFAFMFLSLDMIVDTAAPLKDSEAIKGLFEPLRHDYFLAVLLGLFLTWLFHSSLAFVLLAVSMVQLGIIPFPVGIALVLGANFGSAIPPVVVTANDNSNAKRVTVGNLLMRFVWALALLPFINFFSNFLLQFSNTMDLGRLLVHFHTAFNVALALVCIPFMGWFAKFLQRVIPDRNRNDQDPSEPIYLDDNLISTPSIALAVAARETLRLSDNVEKMLHASIKAIQENDEDVVQKIKDRDDVVDVLFKQIKLYLVRVSKEELTDAESARFGQILSFATNMEHIGDIIVKNLMDVADKKTSKNRNFSDEGFKEIGSMHKAVLNNFKLSVNLFMSGDKKLAEKLLLEKGAIRTAEITASRNHIERLRAGKAETLATTSMHIDILRDLKRINSHIASTAYSFMDEDSERKSDWLNAYNDLIKPSEKKLADLAEAEDAASEKA